MDTTIIEKDTRLATMRASSFPAGIREAFDRLIGKVKAMDGRGVFGISNPVNGVIVYKAGVTELFNGEAEALGLESFTIRKGSYAFIKIPDWQEDETSIGRAFQELLQHPDLDQLSSCVEKYEGKDVVCLVKLNTQ